jgi:uncharacterized protein (TIGR00255 family)
MTGFGSGEHAASEDGAGKILVELRAVNHRFLDVRVRAARELVEMTTAVELLVRGRFTRGRIEVVLHAEGLASSAPVLDRERAKRAYRDLVALRDEIAPSEAVPLSLLAGVPDVFVTREAPLDALREPLALAFEAAARDLDTMRAREGAALERDMREHLKRALALVAEVEARFPDALALGQTKLRERIARLVSAVEVDATRLEQEVAILADRSDIAEETVRLRSHCEQLGALLKTADPVGRRIDFMLQEMSREVNTIGSKSSDLTITRAVVELKVEIERMREQTQNIE